MATPEIHPLSSLPSRAEVWLVDADRTALQQLTEALVNCGYRVRTATSGNALKACLKQGLPDAIVLETRLPDASGYHLCTSLKAIPATRAIPVIFASDSNEVGDKVRAFTVGGVDYITKPYAIEEMLVRIHNQLALRSAQAQVHQLNTQLEERVRQRTAQIEALGRKLLHMASFDALTQLPNRVMCVKAIGRALKRIKRNLDYEFALLLLDCDRFTAINSSLGHVVGDQILIEMARRLKTSLHPGSTLARLGGDEFAILLEDIHSLSDATQMAQRVQDQLRSPFQWEGRDVFLTASIGIVFGSPNYHNPEHLLRDADTAMSRSKFRGRNCYTVFDADMRRTTMARLQLETDLRRAITRQELSVSYQPIVSVATGAIAGFEALVRWIHPERGAISPAEFVPIAEETGEIVPLGLWVLEQVCLQLAHWQTLGPRNHPLTVSVNLSPRQFAQPDLIDRIDGILADTRVSGQHLKLEITETAFIDNADLAAAVLRQLRDRQIQLSIDDFGTGYSSLSYLHRFPANALKIDRSFIAQSSWTRVPGFATDARLTPAIQGSQRPDAIVEAIITMAHQLGMSAIAEGVETAEQLARLRDLNCEFAQGYLFSRPIDSLAASEMLDREFSVIRTLPPKPCRIAKA